MNYIDLFAGAGGLSEGFMRAGFNPVAHVEMDGAACLTMKTRAAYHHLAGEDQLKVYHHYLKGKISRHELYGAVPPEVLETVLHERLAKETMRSTFAKIDQRLKRRKVDLIVGGPPCQVYSLVGRSRIGVDKIKSDVRYTLYKEYGEVLKKYHPKAFVFENVQGLLSIDGGKLLKEICLFLREECGYETAHEVLDASDFGVLQRRRRVILIGRRGKRKWNFPALEENSAASLKVKKTLFDDLPKLNPGEAPPISSYSKSWANKYLKQAQIRNGVSFVTQHVTRPHNEADLEIYSIAIDKLAAATGKTGKI